MSGRQRSLAQTARFHRRVLYGFAVLLSATIGGGATLFVGSAVTRFFEARQNTLVRNQEHAQAEVVRLSSRLMNMADLYEGNWAFHNQEAIPLDRYRQALRDHHGIVTTGSDLAVTPFLLVGTQPDADDRGRLSTMLHIVRRISADPVFDIRRGVTVSGFVYSSDRTILAAAPVTAPFLTPDDLEQDARTFIHANADPIEDRLQSQSEAQLRKSRPLWIALEDPVRQRALAEIVVPIFHGRERVATIVGRVPRDQFLHYFLDASRPEGFFVLAGKHFLPLGAGPTSARDAALLAAVQAQAPRLQAVATGTTLLRDGLTFIVAQRIAGPDWLAVYAFDWTDVVGGMRGEIAAAVLLCIGALALLWTGVGYFDRRVAQPFERDAKKLVEAEEFNRSIIDTAPVGIAVFDPERRSVILENAVARHLFGDAGPHVEFYEAVARAREQSMAVSSDRANTGHSFFEIPWKTASGEMYIGAASSATRFGGRDALLFGLVDITERKTTEAMLIDARRAADRANREKSIFLAIMSHEIRTPLHGATGHLELLSNTSLDAGQRERVGLIRRSFDSLLSLINDLLDTTRIEANALTVNALPIYVNRIVEYCAQHFAPTILAHNVALHCYTDPALDRLLEGDDQRLMQILQNLVSNAAKFTQHGTISVSTTLLDRHDDRLWVRIEVADTGIGIPSALQAMVFKPLVQADASISRRFGGTGLGLFLCRNLAELMGGRITLQSEPNVGSTFGIEVPLRMLDSADEAPPAPLRDISVAVAADDAQLVAMWSGRLERWGARVCAAPSGARPDILIAGPDPRVPPAAASTQPLRGTIRVAHDGPLTPERNGTMINVSLYSTDALLAALLTLAERQAADSDAAASSQPNGGESLDVLVAEDDPVNRVLIADQLRTLGYTSVRIAKDGREALDLWCEREADIVLTDVGMPYLDGAGLLDEIRKRRPNAFVVATTAAGSSDLSPETARRFTHVLRKPVLLAQLRDVLTKAPAVARVPDESRRQADTGDRPPRSSALDAALQQAFAQSWPHERDGIRETFAQRDRDRSRRRLHRLQGALLAVGLDAEAAHCVALQTLCIDGAWAQANDEFDGLCAVLDAFACRADG